MSSRRSKHVRPRPASSGRPQLQPIKAAAPDRRRVRQHPGLSARRRRTPLVLRTGLGLAVVLLAAGVFLQASGGFGTALTALAGGFSTAFNRLVATPVPTASELPLTDSPRITIPNQPRRPFGASQQHPSAGDPTVSATEADTRKIPLPMVTPMTISAVPQNPRRRRRPAGARG